MTRWTTTFILTAVLASIVALGQTDTTLNRQKYIVLKYQNSKADSLILVYKKDFAYKKIFYFKNGNIQSEIYLDRYDNEKKSIHYYENGKKMTKTIRKGRGYKYKIINWDENGKKTSGRYIE